MYKRIKILIGVSILLLMMASAITTTQINNNLSNFPNASMIAVGDKETIDSNNNQKVGALKPGSDGKIPISLLGTQWSSKPGGWWDTDWEYRVNVTVTETGGIDRNNWPIDVYLEFTPPAFKYSIRVVKVDGSTFTEVPYQPWNITYTDESGQYIKSATITFLATVPALSSAKYQIYWSTSYKDLPTFTRKISIRTDTGFYGTIYTFTSIQGWEAVLPPENGGRVMNITLPNGETIGHNWIHFGATKDPTLTYNGYKGVGDTSNMQYTDRYIEEELDELTKSFEGVIFVTYVVKAVPLLDSALSTIAYVDYRLRMYEWGFVISETMYNISSTKGTGTYYLGGWVFDQDDSGPATFDYALLNNIQVEVERSLLYGVGSTSATFNKFRVYSGTGNPYYTVVRAYLTAGSYTLTVRDTNNPNNVYGDDPWVKVFDTSGSLLAETYDINSISLSFTADTDGYYYIMVGAWDDDSPTGFNQGDGVASFTITVGTFSTTVTLSAVNTNGEGYSTLIGYYEYVNDLSALPSSSAFYLSTINVTLNDVNTAYDVEVKWDQPSSDIDVVVYDSLGNIVSYETTTSNPIITTFTPTTVGVYTLLLIQFNGTTTNEEFWVRKFDTTWDYKADTMALIDMQNPRGVGIIKIGSTLPPGVASDTPIWVNYNNWPSPSYTYWAYNMSLTTVPTSPINLDYSLVVFNPTGSTPTERFAAFKDLKDKILNKLSYSLAPVEKFKIRVEIKVVDNDNKNVYGANVSLVNSTSLTISYSALTNTSGWAVLEAIRQSYIINVTLSSMFTFVNDSVTVDYSTTQYVIHSDSKTIKLKNVIRINLKALDNTTSHSYIQNGWLVLRNTSNLSIWGETSTNLTGWADFYVYSGTWEFAFNATGAWDYIALYADSSLTTLVAGPGFNVSYTVTAGTTLYLLDGNITSPPVPTRLYLFNTLTYYDVYWNYTVTVHVNLTELENNTNIDGTVYWKVSEPNGQSILTGTATQVNKGEFEFTIDTGKLPAGQTYTVEISADPSPIGGRKVLKPTPLTISLNVKERPMLTDITFTPGLEIYWNETLSLEVTVKDGLDPTIYLSQATITVKISVEFGTLVYGPLVEVSQGIYDGDLTSTLKSLDTGTYTIIIQIVHGNYTSEAKLYNLKILERPTTLDVPSYIEIPWSSSYVVSVDFVDSRAQRDITQANVSYLLERPTTGEVLKSGQLVYSSGSWISTINLSDVQEGTYSLIIIAGKKNYENITSTITFIIRLHQTSATASSYTISVYYKQNVSVKISYYDIDESVYIANANASARVIGSTISGSPVTLMLEDLGDGTYLLNFNTSRLNALGAYTITITIRKPHMETRTVTITLEVKVIPTISTSDKSSDTKEWGEMFNLTLSYRESLTGKGIIAENYTYEIYMNATKVMEENATMVKPGVYFLSFNTSEIGIGTFVIYVHFDKTFYESRTLVISLEVIPIPTLASVSSSNITIYWNDTSQVVFRYIRTDTLKGVSKATVMYRYISFENGSTIGREIVASTSIEGELVITFNANKTFVPGSYILVITAIKENFESASLQVNIHVKERPLSAALSNENIALVWGDIYNVSLIVTDGITGKAVFLSSQEIALSDNLNNSIELVIGGGNYFVSIDTTKLSKPITTPTTITISIKKMYYEQKTIAFKIRVDTVTVEVVLSGPSSVTLNPITGGSTTYTAGIFDKSRGGKPITTASVNLVISTGADKYSIKMESSQDQPGFYQATVDWTHIPIFKPGESYTITVEFENISINGVNLTGDLIWSVVKPEVKGSTSTTVDYLGGSADIPGFGRVPALIAYPILIAILVIGSVIGYKAVLYFNLPPEVREIDKLIKQIKKDVLEYEAPSREDAIRAVLDEEL